MMRNYICAFYKWLNGPLKLNFDRTIASRSWSQWILPLVIVAIPLLVLILLFGLHTGSWYIGDTKEFVPSGNYEPSNIFEAAYYHLITNGGQNLLSGSPIIGLIFTTIGIIIIAILTSSITNFLEQRAKGYINGETRYRISNHYVILGANDIIYSIIREITEVIKHNGYIIIQTGKDVEKTRREVFSFIDSKIHKRIIFYFGERTSEDDMHKLNLDSAKEVFIIGGGVENDGRDSYRDAYNIDSIEAIYNVLKEKDETLCEKRDLEKEKTEKDQSSHKKLTCRVMFEYQTTFSVFQHSDIGEKIKEKIAFEPFNFHEMWAQKVLILGRGREDKKDIRYKFLDQLPEKKQTENVPQDSKTEANSIQYLNKGSKERVHLIIVGMSKMGVALGIEAAHLCHYPNYVTNSNLRTRITFIDANAKAEENFFGGRFANLKKLSRWEVKDADNIPTDKDLYCSNIEFSETNKNQEDWLDIEWEFIHGRIEQQAVRDYLVKASQDKETITTIAVCLPQAHQAIAAALYLPDEVYDNSLQILVYQRLSGSIVKQIAQEGNKYSKLLPFGMIDEGYSSELADDTKAIMVNYVYDTVYSVLEKYKQTNPFLCDKDISEKDWNEIDYKLVRFKSETEANEWTKKEVFKRWSSKYNAFCIDSKLRCIEALSQNTKNREEKINDSINILMIVEHNRWNIEKLLANYRPVTKDEYSQVIAEERLAEDLKNGAKKAHICICDFETLQKRHKKTCNNDKAIVLAIPYIKELIDKKSAL